jgi:hypothetical protein
VFSDVALGTCGQVDLGSPLARCLGQLIERDDLDPSLVHRLERCGLHPQILPSKTISRCRADKMSDWAGRSTADQILSSALDGEALLMARRPKLRPLIDPLREQAQGRDDIRTECAGVVAGSWFARPARQGEDLISCSPQPASARLPYPAN